MGIGDGLICMYAVWIDGWIVSGMYVCKKQLLDDHHFIPLYSISVINCFYYMVSSNALCV